MKDGYPDIRKSGYREDRISGDRDIRKSKYRETRELKPMKETNENTKSGMKGLKTLRIWKEAHELMLKIHNIAKKLPSDERFRKRDQIERSSSSVADNIAEGYGAYYYNVKIRSLYTARKEAVETQNHLEALKDKGLLKSETASKLINNYENLIRGINGYIKYICEKRDEEEGR